MYVSGVIWESIVDGEGIRSVVFVSGCQHNCGGCHNPLTHNFKYGVDFTLEKQLEFIDKVNKNPLLDGITLSGGDSMFSVDDTIDFIRLFKSKCKDMTIWIYTGFTYEQLISDFKRLELLKLCDILVDGKFIESKKDLTGVFKGSVNQRMISIQESLKQNKVVLYET